MKIAAIRKENFNTCCFTGIRPQKLPFDLDEGNLTFHKIKEAIKQEIQILIEEQQVTHFISGMALGVDQWAAEAVLSLKKIYPYLTLECAIPCETQAEKWNELQRERYFSIIERCSKETLLQTRYSYDCMQKRNRYMVDNSRFMLAVWDGSPGGTAFTIRHAQKKERIVRIIDPRNL